MKPRKEMHQQARAVMRESEQKLLQSQGLGSTGDVDRRLRSQIGELKILLLDVPDDLQAIQNKIDEMRQALTPDESESAKPAIIF